MRLVTLLSPANSVIVQYYDIYIIGIIILIGEFYNAVGFKKYAKIVEILDCRTRRLPRRRRRKIIIAKVLRVKVTVLFAPEFISKII